MPIKSDDAQSKDAKLGERMIEVKVRFLTNNIAEGDGKIIPKHAWTSGVVRMERNAPHGIKPSSPIPFHSLLDVGAAIEKLLVKEGVMLHLTKKMKKYVSEG